MPHYTYTTEETLEAFRSAYPKLNIQTEDVEKIIQQWVMNNPGKLIERGMLPDECKQFIDGRFEHLQGVFEWAVLRGDLEDKNLDRGFAIVRCEQPVLKQALAAVYPVATSKETDGDEEVQQMKLIVKDSEAFIIATDKNVTVTHRVGMLDDSLPHDTEILLPAEELHILNTWVAKILKSKQSITLFVTRRKLIAATKHQMKYRVFRASKHDWLDGVIHRVQAAFNAKAPDIVHPMRINTTRIKHIKDATILTTSTESSLTPFVANNGDCFGTVTVRRENIGERKNLPIERNNGFFAINDMFEESN